MRRICLTIFILQILAYGCYGQNPIVSIASIDIVNDKHLKMSWTIENGLNIQPTRFRVQYGIEDANVGLEYADWPAQLVEVSYDTNEQPYHESTTNSVIDCLNECVLNVSCKFVVWKNQLEQNCLLKRGFDGAKKTILPRNTKAMKLAEYTANEVDLYNLPSNTLYQFKLAIYDNAAAQWLSTSTPYGLDTRLNIHLEYERVGLQFIKFKWTNPFDFTASRFTMQIEKNSGGLRGHEILPLDTIDLEPRYYDLKSSDTFVLSYTANEEACKSACSSALTCVAYAYSSKYDDIYQFDNEWCVFKSAVNVANGRFRDDTMILTKSLINYKREWIYSRFEADTYKFILEGRTPYGSKFQSQTGYYKAEEKPLSLTLTPNFYDLTISIEFNINDEDVDSHTRYMIMINDDTLVPADHYYVLSTGYTDPTEVQVTAENFNECHEFCIYDWKCLAIKWAQIKNECFFIYDTSNPIPCPSNTICSTIPQYSKTVKMSADKVGKKYCLGAIVQPTDKTITYAVKATAETCVEVNFNVNVAGKSTFVEGETASIMCEFDKIPDNVPYKVIWLKDGKTLNGDEGAIQFQDDNKTLAFTKLDHHLHTGAYSCLVLFSEGVSYPSNPFIVFVDHEISIIVPNDMVVVVNTMDVIPCIGEGRASFDLVWRRENSDVDLKNVKKTYPTELSLVITNATVDDAGTYVCYDRNNMKSFASLKVKVITQPSQIRIKKLKQYEESIYIEWSTDTNGNTPLTALDMQISDDCSKNNTCEIFYTLSVPLTIGDSTSSEYTLYYKLKNSGNLQIRAKNKVNYGDYSDVQSLTLANINKKHILTHPYFTPFVVFLLTSLVLLVLVFVFMKKADISLLSCLKCKDNANESFINLSYSAKR